MRALLIGDVHSVINELDDCENLLKLIDESYREYNCDYTIFMGDQYQYMDTVSVRVMNFWKKWFKVLKKTVLIVGNHDQAGKGLEHLHALAAHDKDVFMVVDKPATIKGDSGNITLFPYYSDVEKFLVDINEKFKEEPDSVLLCHQTFDGSKYENGFYAKDGIEVNKIPFKKVISGHIHAPQKLGDKVYYLGAPRWRILSDANIKRNIWVVDINGDDFKLVRAIPTNICRRIFRFKDTPEVPIDIEKIEADPKDKVVIDLIGPVEWINEREPIFRGRGFIIKAIPENNESPTIKESEGIGISLNKFIDVFDPPNCTPIETLRKMIDDRIDIRK